MYFLEYNGCSSDVYIRAFLIFQRGMTQGDNKFKACRRYQEESDIQAPPPYSPGGVIAEGIRTGNVSMRGPESGAAYPLMLPWSMKTRCSKISFWMCPSISFLITVRASKGFSLFR